VQLTGGQAHLDLTLRWGFFRICAARLPPVHGPHIVGRRIARVTFRHRGLVRVG